MGARIGTSGWSYDHRQDVLYHGCSPAERLARYVAEFDTVELNASFYRWPRDATFTSWQRRLPLGFLMRVKAPRDLTHARRLYAPEYWAGRITVGCATYQELGEHVRLSANTVADRVRRLRRDGVLTGFAAVIDEKALGMELGVLSDLKLKEGVSRVAFAESLTHVPQVIGALRLTGEYDYQLHIVCRSTTELESVIERLKGEFDVATVNSRLILREVPVDKAKLLAAIR